MIVVNTRGQCSSISPPSSGIPPLSHPISNIRHVKARAPPLDYTTLGTLHTMAPSRGATTFTFFQRCRTDSICPRCLHPSRPFTTTLPSPSGHNRWSKIKHDKAKTDASKNRQRSLFSQELATLSRLYGPEPQHNPRLADAITKAKREGFPKANIEGAIARGQGRSASGASLESVTFEGILPGNVGVIVECETDNRLRTMATLKLALKDAGGSASPSAYLFRKRGRVGFGRKEGIGVEEALEAALEAGAEDVDEDGGDGGLVVWSEPGDTKAVGEKVASALGLEVKASEIVWCPNEETRVGLAGEEVAEELGSFVDDLQEKEMSLQAVAMNVAQGSVGDEAWKELAGRLSG